MSFARVESVQHEIHAHYRALRAIRTRKALERSALWAEIGSEVGRVLESVERGDWAPVPPPAAVPAPRGRVLRAVAWDIQRGARLDGPRGCGATAGGRPGAARAGAAGRGLEHPAGSAAR